MTTEAVQAAKVYRHLLKAIVKHIGQEGSTRHFRDFVTQEFRKNVNVPDADAKQKLKLAQDYTFLLKSVQHQRVFLSLSQDLLVHEFEFYLNLKSFNVTLLA